MYLATTRFNNKTLDENRKFKEKNKIQGVVYGSPMKINEKYPLGCFMFVVEMNNDTNEILGISIIKNFMLFDDDEKYNIYGDGNFNRYIYRGKLFLERNDILKKNPLLVSILENILFKGKSHLKRIAGIAVIREKLLCDKRCLGLNLIAEIKKLYKEYFIQ